MSASYDNPYGANRAPEPEPDESLRPATEDALEQGMPARQKTGKRSTV